MPKHPARHLQWESVDSSNVDAIARTDGGMYVRFTTGDVYLYRGVSRQRAVACRDSASCGRYLNKVIQPQYEAVKIT